MAQKIKDYGRGLYIDFLSKTLMMNDLAFVERERHGFQVNLDDVELREYTGLKDKNGKEEYFDDIVKIFAYGKDRIAVVKQDEYGYIYYENTTDTIGNTKGFQLYRWDKEFEIIGNVYENKDLLEKGKQT